MPAPDDLHTLLVSAGGVLLAFFTVLMGAAAVALAARLKTWGAKKRKPHVTRPR